MEEDIFEVAETTEDASPQIRSHEAIQEKNSHLNDQTKKQLSGSRSIPVKTAQTGSSMVQEAYKIMKQMIKERHERDEFSLFGEQVAIKLRKMSSSSRSIVQHIINTTIFDAECGKYDSPSTPFPYPGSTLNLQLQIPVQGACPPACDPLQKQSCTASYNAFHTLGSNNVQSVMVPYNTFPPTGFHQASVQLPAKLPPHSSASTSSIHLPSHIISPSMGLNHTPIQLPANAISPSVVLKRVSCQLPASTISPPAGLKLGSVQLSSNTVSSSAGLNQTSVQLPVNTPMELPLPTSVPASSVQPSILPLTLQTIKQETEPSYILS